MSKVYRNTGGEIILYKDTAGQYHKTMLRFQRSKTRRKSVNYLVFDRDDFATPFTVTLKFV